MTKTERSEGGSQRVLSERRGQRWGLRDQIAFECALEQDEQEDWQTLRRRDARLDISEEEWHAGERRAIARRWLEQRLEDSEDLRTATDTIEHSIRIAGQLLGVVAFAMGLSGAAGALAYSGEAPINVSWFFGVFVLMQAVMGAALCVAFVMPLRFRESMASGPLFRLFRYVFTYLLSIVQRLAGRYLDGKKRQKVAELASAAKVRAIVHGSALKWLVFGKVQGAALAFNLGALLSLLALVAFSDRAFGWQTTLDVSNDSVQNVVEGFAIPWSWAWEEGNGFPSALQIEGSRIVLKDGIKMLETENLTAWWKFLALGILCYGALPRALFWLLGRWQLSSALLRYDFRNAAAERLFMRLDPGRNGFEAERSEGAIPEGILSQAIEDPRPVSQRKVVVLLGAELAAVYDPKAVGEALSQHWNLSEESLDLRVAEPRGSLSCDGSWNDYEIALVFESWMPPIKEVERQLRWVRSEVAEKAMIRIVLLGIPEEGGEAVSLRLETRYEEVWDAFLRRLGDPYLVLENRR